MPASEPYQEVIDFLIDPKRSERIGSAYDLVMVWPRVCEQLELKFWTTLKQIADHRLKEQSVTNWEASFWANGPTDARDLLTERYAGLRLTPIGATSTLVQWSLLVEGTRSSKQPSLGCGVNFWNNNDEAVERVARSLPPWARTLHKTHRLSLRMMTAR